MAQKGGTTKAPFVMKAFKNLNSMDAAKVEETWLILENAIDQIFKQNQSLLSFEELYRSAYNLVLNKKWDMLYTKVCNTIQSYLRGTVTPKIVESPSELLLRVISEAWTKHKVDQNMIKDVLMYMDKNPQAGAKKTPIYNAGLILFRESVLFHGDIRDRMRGILLSRIQSERNGLLIDRDETKTILRMLQELGVDGASVYDDEFEKFFLESSRAFYRQESSEFLAQNSVPDFLTKAEFRLSEESARIRNYLLSTTEPKLKSLMEYEYISTHARALVEMEHSGCVCLMKEDKFNDLRRMYALFSRLPFFAGPHPRMYGDLCQEMWDRNCD